MMSVTLSARNFVLKPRTEKMIRNKVALRLDKLLQNFDDSLKKLNLKIEKDKIKTYHLTCELNLPKKEKIFCQTSHIHLKSALTDLSQQAEKQIKRYKDTLTPYSLG